MSKKSIRLCHNDLNNLNIMQLRDSGDIFLIDFEYSRMNYLAYDLANFLNECAFDYTGSSSPGFELKTELIASQEEIRQVSETYVGGIRQVPEASGACGGGFGLRGSSGGAGSGHL